MQIRLRSLFKFNYFCFTFKANEKKKRPLKNMVWRGSITRKCKRGGGCCLTGVLGIFKKREVCQEREEQK